MCYFSFICPIHQRIVIGAVWVQLVLACSILIDNGFLDDIASTRYKGKIVYNHESDDLNLGVKIDI